MLIITVTGKCVYIKDHKQSCRSNFICMSFLDSSKLYSLSLFSFNFMIESLIWPHKMTSSWLVSTWNANTFVLLLSQHQHLFLIVKSSRYFPLLYESICCFCQWLNFLKMGVASIFLAYTLLICKPPKRKEKEERGGKKKERKKGGWIGFYNNSYYFSFLSSMSGRTRITIITIQK